MSKKEKSALLNVIFYIFGCITYLAGAKIPDHIAKDLEILGFKKEE
jgi:hypothetical protein